MYILIDSFINFTLGWRYACETEKEGKIVHINYLEA